MTRKAEQAVKMYSGDEFVDLEKLDRFHLNKKSHDDLLSCWDVPRNRLTTVEADPTPAFPPAVAAERARDKLRLAAMERRIRDLERKYESLLAFVTGHPTVERRGSLVDPKIETVVQITEELFEGGTIEIEREHEPDDPGDSPFVVFRVQCSGALKEMVAKEKEWNRRVREARSGHSGQLRLLVCPVE